MRKSHILILGLVILTFGLSALAADAPAGVVNINTADASQLVNLPRVGAKAAQRIIDYRKEHGPFSKTTDLLQVKGFGEKSYELLRPYLTVDGKTTLATKVRSPRKPRTSKSPTSTAAPK